MRWRNTLLCLVTIVAAASGSSAQEPSGRSDQDILTQLEREWDAAFHRKDVPFIANILADEFVVTYADGTRADKAKELSLAAEFNQQIDSSVLDEFVIKIYGDLAVVRFTQHLVGPSQGKPLALTFRYIDVFVMRAGRWQCFASQSTKVTAA